MNCYHLRVPRAAFGAAAVALTTLTFALLVLLPAKLEGARHTFAVSAQHTASAQHAVSARVPAERGSPI